MKPRTSKCLLDGPDNKYFKITGDMVSVTNIALCHCTVEAATDKNMQKNRQG